MSEKYVSAEYLAGFVDGEGSISLRPCKGATTLTPKFSIETTNERVMIIIKKTIEHWNIRVCYVNLKPRKLGRRASYRVAVNALDSVLRFLAIIQPHLIVKQKQASIVTDYIVRRLSEKDINSDSFTDFALDKLKEVRMHNIIGD